MYLRVCSLLVCLLAFLTSFSQYRAFYVDSTGSDTNDGSAAAPWQTVAAANFFDFEPGDTLFFSGGQMFGQLKLQNNDAGLTIMSTNGMATLGGLYAYNVGDITIDGVAFKGEGTVNKLDGIKFYMDGGAAGDLNNIILKNVTVSNFGGNGILIGAWETYNGYNNVQVLNSSIYENGIDGLASYGYNDTYNHTQVYIDSVKSYRNYGRTDITTTNTGSGILIGGFDGGTIEHCEAFENGKNNRNAGGGPQGIWCYNSKNLVIQYSVSHDNQAGSKMDGGGFDIDGGSQNCIIQYCNSYNNEGAGFAFFEYGSTNQFTNNTIRYNISENDARKNANGAFLMWAYDTSNRVKNSSFYNNTVYLTPSATASSGYPVALYVKGSNVKNVSFYNNILYAISPVKLLSGSTTNISFSNNDYYTPGTTPNLTTGGIVKDPLFVNVGGGKDGYVLRALSPAVDAGKAHNVVQDIIGTAVPQNSGYDIGAYESPLKPPVVNAGPDQAITLPVDSITLDASGSSDPDGTIASYSWKQTFGPSTYQIDAPDAAATTVSNLVQGTYTFQVTVTDNDGITRSDDVQVVVNPEEGRKVINVNLYGGTNPYTDTAWNNWNIYSSKAIKSLKYSDGATSTVSATLSASNGASDNGSTYGGIMAAPEVLRYTDYSSSARTLTISGLSKTKTYNLELYASRNSKGNTTIFSIGSKSVSVVTDNNKTQAANFTALRTNTSGQIKLSLDKIGTYNYLTGFVLTENPDSVAAAIAPKVSAGPDQTLTLPDSTIALNGSASDADGSIFKYVWTKVSGPSQYTIDAPNSDSTSVSNLVEGTYTFRLTVTDDEGLTSYDDVIVTVYAALPSGVTQVRVNLYGGTNPYNNTAWNNWNIYSSRTKTALNYSDGTPSTVTATLSTSNGASDNGSTYGGTMAPPEVLRYTDYSSSARTLTISGLSRNKTYDLELYASRNSTGNTTIFSIGSKSVSVVTDGNKTKAANFTALRTNTSGQLVLNIDKTGSYNFLSGFVLTEHPDSVAAAIAPKVSAGPDQTLTLPNSTVALNGSASDADGSIFKYVWTKTAGPSQYTIDAPNSDSTTVNNLVEGTYTFRLTVTDDEGLTSYDNVVVYVNAAIPSGVKLVRVNLYGGSNPYTNTAWNNWNIYSSKTSKSLKYSDASTSTIGAVVSASSGIYDNGSTYGGTMAPPEVVRYTSYSGSMRTLTISGLSTSNIYNLDLYASRNSSGNSTIFTVGSTSITIVTDQNKTNTATFTGLVPNSAGQIVVTLNKSGTYNFLNGFTLTENAPTDSITRNLAQAEMLTEVAEGRLRVQAYPNPTMDHFTLKIESQDETPVQLRIVDALGRTTEIIQNVTPNKLLSIGATYKPGLYFAQVIQNQRKVTVKLVKGSVR